MIWSNWGELYYVFFCVFVHVSIVTGLGVTTLWFSRRIWITGIKQNQQVLCSLNHFYAMQDNLWCTRKEILTDVKRIIHLQVLENGVVGSGDSGSFACLIKQELLVCNYYGLNQNSIILFWRISVIKAYILPKTPCELRSNFQMMQVLKLVYIDSKRYWLTIRIYFGRK